MRLFDRYYPGDNPITGERNPTHWTVLGLEMWRFRYSTEWKGQPYLPPRIERKPWQWLGVRLGPFIYCFSWADWRDV